MAATPRCSALRPYSRGRYQASGAGPGGGPSCRRRRGAWCCAHLSCGRYHWPRPPFFAARAAVDLDAAAVDEQSVGRIVLAGQGSEDPFPDAALRPAHEAVVERLLRSVDLLRTIAPATAALERMDDPGEHPTIIDPRHPARVARQHRLNPNPLPSENQKKSDISPPPSRKAMNHNSSVRGISTTPRV